jgi:hypothetical protein
LKKIKEKEDGRKVNLGSKSPGNELLAYLEEVLPDYSRESVYASDVKKMISWYNVLMENEINLEEEEKEPQIKEEETPDLDEERENTERPEK